MFTKTTEEAVAIMLRLDKDLDRLADGRVDGARSICTCLLARPQQSDRNILSRQMIALMDASRVGPEPVAGFRGLFLTEYGIWPSSEDWYLYYTLRRFSGDYRQIQDAPCHIFLSHEGAELFSFLSLALRSGWGGILFGNADDVSIAFSHDDWLRVACHSDVVPLEELMKNLGWQLSAEKLQGGG